VLVIYRVALECGRRLTVLGRAVKTTFILKYANDCPMRDGVCLQLNRGESRHQLGRRLFFANQGISPRVTTKKS
jgi:TnpA family transposase